MKNIVIFLALLFNLNLFAENNINFKVGLNYSQFLNDNSSEIYQGYTFGLSYDYYIDEKWSIDGGVFYSKEGGILKDKIVRTINLFNNPLDTTYSHSDIYSVAGFFKLPITIGYSFLVSNQVNLKLYGGFSFLIPFKDYSTTKNVRPIFIENNDVKFEYEHVGMGESVFELWDNKNYSIDLGCLLKYNKKILIDFNINYHLRNFGTFDNISEIKKQLLSFKILLGIVF